jgi:hypothetical protein
VQRLALLEHRQGEHEIAAFDALGLENSVARVRALTAIVQVGARLLETGEIEERVAALEAAVVSR